MGGSGKYHLKEEKSQSDESDPDEVITSTKRTFLAVRYFNKILVIFKIRWNLIIW
jgi:hypothetical protein